DRRLERLGITQIRTPFRTPQANSIAERWVRSVRQECLDYTLIFSERHLRRLLAEYITYFNQWRPHRSIGQRAPCAPVHRKLDHQSTRVVAEPVLGGLHHPDLPSFNFCALQRRWAILFEGEVGPGVMIIPQVGRQKPSEMVFA